MEAKISRSLYDRQLAYPQPNESSLPIREPWSSTSTLAQVGPLQLDSKQLDDRLLETHNELSGPGGNTLIYTNRESPFSYTFKAMTFVNRTTGKEVDKENPTHKQDT